MDDNLPTAEGLAGHVLPVPQEMARHVRDRWAELTASQKTK